LMAALLTQSPGLAYAPTAPAESTTAPAPPDLSATPLGDILEELRADAAALRNQFTTLGQRLRAAGDALGTLGEPPESELFDALVEARTRFENLRARSADLASLHGLAPVTTDACHSLKDIELVCDSLARVESDRANSREQLTAAMRMLERVQAIEHRDGKAIEDLEECKARARDKHSTLLGARSDNAPVDASALLLDLQSYRQLLSLIEAADDLDDSECQALFESVAADFGKLLATVALRGKLSIALHSPAPALAPASATPAREKEPEDALAVREHIPTVQPGMPESRIGDTPLPVTDAAPVSAAIEEVLEAAGPDRTIPTDHMPPAGESPVEPPRELEPPPPAIDDPIATPPESVPETSPPTSVEDSLWTLLLHNRPGLAFHLAQAAEESGASAVTEAQFVHLWHRTEGGWKVSRILSFEHRNAPR
jgi:hypothetical protein